MKIHKLGSFGFAMGLKRENLTQIFVKLLTNWGYRTAFKFLKAENPYFGMYRYFPYIVFVMFNALWLICWFMYKMSLVYPPIRNLMSPSKWRKRDLYSRGINGFANCRYFGKNIACNIAVGLPTGRPNVFSELQLSKSAWFFCMQVTKPSWRL